MLSGVSMITNGRVESSSPASGGRVMAGGVDMIAEGTGGVAVVRTAIAHSSLMRTASLGRGAGTGDTSPSLSQRGPTVQGLRRYSLSAGSQRGRLTHRHRGGRGRLVRIPRRGVIGGGPATCVHTRHGRGSGTATPATVSSHTVI